jgi:hypothetical protein
VPLYLLSRSRIRKRTPRSPRSRPRFARLLGDPGAGRVRRTAGEPDPTIRVRDEEQHVVAAQEEALDREEIARDDTRSLRSQKLAPTRAAAPRRRLQPRVGEQPTDARRDTRKPSLASSPQIRRWPQRGFSRASRQTNSRTSAGSFGRPRRPNAADGRPRPPTGPDQACRASAARPAAARRLSRAGPGGYEQARQAEPAPRDRGTRRPCRRSSQSSRQEEATSILAPFRRPEEGYFVLVTM